MKFEIWYFVNQSSLILRQLQRFFEIQSSRQWLWHAKYNLLPHGAFLFGDDLYNTKWNGH